MHIVSLVLILYFIGPASCQDLVENVTSGYFESAEMTDTTEDSAIAQEYLEKISSVAMEATVTTEVMEQQSTKSESQDSTQVVTKETNAMSTEMGTEVVSKQVTDIVETARQTSSTTKSTVFPNVTCQHHNSRCNAMLKQSLDGTSNVQICSGLNDTLSCFDLAMSRCNDTEGLQDLHNSKLLVIHQHVTRCNACQLDDQVCHQLDLTSKKSHACRDLWFALLCYRRAVHACHIPGMKKLLVERKELNEHSYNYYCRRCGTDQRKCDKLYERVGLNINERDLCNTLSQSISCYNKGLEDCEDEEERRIMISSRTVAEKEHMAECNPCIVEIRKCKELLDGSFVNIDVVNICSKLPAARTCLEKGDKVCTNPLEMRLLETNKGVVKKQLEIMCETRMLEGTTSKNLTKARLIETTTVKRVQTCLEEANVCSHLASDVAADQIHTKYMCSKLNHSRYCFISVMEKCLTKREENILDTLMLSVDQQYYLHCKKFEEDASLGGSPQLRMGLLEQDVKKLGANAASRQRVVPNLIKSIFFIWTFSLMRFRFALF